MRNIAGTPEGFRLAIASSLVALGLLAAFPVQAQGKNETLVSSERELVDSEFSQSRGMITWCDYSGALWIAGIDRDTGLFIPADGKGLLIDPSAMTTGDLQVVGNGPEWIGTATGDQIVYTKFLADKPHTIDNARLAVAVQSGESDWSYGYLPPHTRRNGPYASHDPGDPAPRISYVDARGNHYWRDLFDASSETAVPQFPKSRLSMRFVEGARAAVFAAPVEGTPQVFMQWLDSDTPKQLTFDDGSKDLHTVPWGWRAPEFDGDFVIATVADDTELRIYRRRAGSRGEDATWELVRSARTPRNGVINSPEPFVHEGKSYVVFSATSPPGIYPTVVYLASIDPAAPSLVQLTPDLPRRIRRDPEVFVASDGPYVYYNRLTMEGGGYCLACNEGVYRSHTGLPPAQQ
ncbi:hypothetical protein MQC88_11540 [Luteimonas sp. 50]|uniref:WD40 repeat protein n=1 Tax=Cognatiluteimonas sedimenti TaxID=2927791 RepID=A0ABT0A6G1_9GAMM|nr:hypothetical protein [Lysobacter sedimenti]MCJ0826575.1 hypothetical protein [Lysobacter sedimenti]